MSQANRDQAFEAIRRMSSLAAAAFTGMICSKDPIENTKDAAWFGQICMTLKIMMDKYPAIFWLAWDSAHGDLVYKDILESLVMLFL